MLAPPPKTMIFVDFLCFPTFSTIVLMFSYVFLSKNIPCCFISHAFTHSRTCSLPHSVAIWFFVLFLSRHHGPSDQRNQGLRYVSAKAEASEEGNHKDKEANRSRKASQRASPCGTTALQARTLYIYSQCFQRE